MPAGSRVSFCPGIRVAAPPDCGIQPWHSEPQHFNVRFSVRFLIRRSTRPLGAGRDLAGTLALTRKKLGGRSSSKKILRSG